MDLGKLPQAATSQLFSVHLCLVLIARHFSHCVCVFTRVYVHVFGLPEHVSPCRALTATPHPPNPHLPPPLPFLFQPVDALIEKGVSVSR